MRGFIPYRDVIDIKPPGIYYVYAVAISTFGNSAESIRTFTAIYSLFTLGSLYCLARYLHGITAGIFAALLYAFYSCAPLTQGSSSNTEVFMVLPLLISTFLFIVAADRGSRHLIVASGTFAGFAMLIKTVALPYVILLFVASFFINKSKTGYKDRVIDVACYVTPLFIMATLTMAYFWYNNALNEFIYWNVSLPFVYSSGDVVESKSVFYVLRTIAPELLLLFILAVPTAVWFWLEQRDLKRLIISLMLPAAFLGVCMPGKFFPHYFIQLFPFMALLGGLGLGEILKRKRKLLYLSYPVIIAAFSYYVYKDYKYFFVLSPTEVSVAKYGNIFVDSVVVSDYIKKRTEPSDYILQLGFEPELYFLTELRSTTPYVSTIILNNDKNPWTASLSMIRSIKNKKPKYIIVQPEFLQIPFVEAFEKKLNKDYKLETTIGNSNLYIRRSTNNELQSWQETKLSVHNI